MRPAKASNQPGHPPSLIRVFTVCDHWIAEGLRFLHADSEDSGQTGQMPRLILVFAGCTGHSIDFVMKRLKFLNKNNKNDNSDLI